MEDERSHHERISALERHLSELEERLERRVSELEVKIDGPPPTQAELEQKRRKVAASEFEQRYAEGFATPED